MLHKDNICDFDFDAELSVPKLCNNDIRNSHTERSDSLDKVRFQNSEISKED